MFTTKSHSTASETMTRGPFFKPKVQTKLRSDIEPLQKMDEEEAIQAQEEEEEMLQTMEEEEAQTKLQFKGQPQGSKAVHRVAKSGFMGTGGAYPFFNKIQTSFGRHDVSGVKAYTDSAAIKANKSLGALAYASGNKVAFKKAPDLHTAAHEAAHVIQQNKGVQLKDGLGTKNDKYERHADAVADKVVQGKSAESLLSNSPTGSTGKVNRKAVQFDQGLAQAWDVYVYPGHADPTWDSETTENVRRRGSQVRSYQSLRGRNQSRENGNRIVNVDSGHLDRGTDNSRFQDSQTTTSTAPNVWFLEVVDNLLFDGAPTPTDLTQRGLADCFILAPLQAMAANPTGKAKLQANAKETGGKYQVDLHRLQIIGGDCIPHPSDMLRVRMDNVISDRAVEGSTRTTPLSATQIATARTQDPRIAPTDTVTGTITKRILWPWAYEKAFAAVRGGYSEIDFGDMGAAMMVLTGRASTTYGVASIDIPKLYGALPAHLAHNKIASAGTKPKPQLATQGYHSSFSIVNATEADGVKVRSGLTGPVSNWIPWNTFLNRKKSYTIMDFSNILNFDVTSIPDTEVSNHRETLINAANDSMLMVTGLWKDYLVFGKNLWVGPRHAYSISAASGTTVDFRNPWGVLHLNGLSQNSFSDIFGTFSFEI